MISARYLCLCVAVVLGVGIAQADADLIDFEHRPDGSTPVDDSVLNAPYDIEGGGRVGFFFDMDGDNSFDPRVDRLPLFEATGTDGTDGFVSTTGPGAPTFDRARQGYGPELGHYFLRQPSGIGPVPAPFLIIYDTTQAIRGFSGEIWDIDGGGPNGTEQWRVDVLDRSGTVLATRLSPLGDHGGGVGSLDSLPWNFAFRDLPDGVQAIRLTFVGTKADGVGLAFNNFSATQAVPEPASVVSIALGALGILGFVRRRKPGAM